RVCGATAMSRCLTPGPGRVGHPGLTTLRRVDAGGLTRVAAGLAALAAGVAAVVVVAVLLSHTPGPVEAEAAPSAPAITTTQAPASPPTSPAPAAFPAPPSGAVVFARADGSNVLALAARPQENRLLL